MRSLPLFKSMCLVTCDKARNFLHALLFINIRFKAIILEPLKLFIEFIFTY